MHNSLDEQDENEQEKFSLRFPCHDLVYLDTDCKGFMLEKNIFSSTADKVSGAYPIPSPPSYVVCHLSVNFLQIK